MALFAVRLLPSLWKRGVKCPLAGMFGKDIQEIIGKDGLEAGANVEMFLRVVVHAYRYYGHRNACFLQHIERQGDVYGGCVHLIDGTVYVAYAQVSCPVKIFRLKAPSLKKCFSVLNRTILS